jgi:hypothetical protein
MRHKQNSPMAALVLKARLCFCLLLLGKLLALLALLVIIEIAIVLTPCPMAKKIKRAFGALGCKLLDKRANGARHSARRLGAFRLLGY